MAEVGSYQWAVLVAAFMTHILLGIVLDSGGTLHVIFLEALHGGSGDTAMANSLIACTFYAFAPVTGVLVVNYPLWQVALAGGLLGGLGLIFSAFVYSLPMLYLTFGVFAGTGMGLAYVPTITCTGQVFTKYRSMAFGIGSSGIGVGKFLGPFLISKAEAEYGWRGCLLLLGGITLNLCVCAMVYLRPSEMNFKEQRDSPLTEGGVDDTCPKPNALEDDVGAVVAPLGESMKSASLINGFSIDRLAYTHSDYSLAAISENTPANNQDFTTGDNSNKILPLDKLENGSIYCSGKVCHNENENCPGTGIPVNGISCMLKSPNGTNEALINKVNSIQAGDRISCLKAEMSLENGPCTIVPVGDHDLSPIDPQERWRRELLAEGDMSSLPAALSTSSLFLSEAASTDHIPAVRSLLYRSNILNGSIRSSLGLNSCQQSKHTSQNNLPMLNSPAGNALINREGPQVAITNSTRKNGSSTPRSTSSSKKSFKLNAFLMKDPHFLTLCINNLIYSMGYALAHVHLPAFCMARGETAESGNLLVSTVGISSLVGKILLGYIAQQPCVSPMSVYTVTSLMASAATAILAFCYGFPLFLAYAIFFGFISGSFGAVLPSLVVSMTTMELLPSAYGFLLVFEAVGFLLGPSIGGWLYDATGVYAASFLFGGVIMAISSSFMFYPWYRMYYPATNNTLTANTAPKCISEVDISNHDSDDDHTDNIDEPKNTE